jgi:hypothetical protein
MAVWSTGYFYLRKLKCQYCGNTFGIFPFHLAMAVWSTGYVCIWESLNGNICGNTFGIFPFHLAMASWYRGLTTWSAVVSILLVCIQYKKRKIHQFIYLMSMCT